MTREGGAIIASDLTTCLEHLSVSDPARVGHLLDLLTAGLAAADPERAVLSALTALAPATPTLTVAAIGKASPAMSRAAATAYPGVGLNGIAVSDHGEPTPPGIELLIGSHPTPTASSVEAGRRLMTLVADASDEILFLVSGGGSSLVEVPADGLELDDVVEVFRLLTSAGVPIQDLNVVRTHLSAIKGGRLGALATVPHRTVVISDVTEGPAHLVSSGPTVTCPTTPGDAIDILRQHGLVDRMPPRVMQALRTAPLPPVVVPGRVVVAADGASAVAAIGKHGARVLSTSLGGLAASAAHRAIEETPMGTIGAFSGETTVNVTGTGVGGRNQEAALAAALAIEGTSTIFAALGTDGVDGPTDAAGAVVDGSTAARIRAAGIDPDAALSNNDSHTALNAAGALLRPGPTGTNVADLWLIDRSC